MEKYYCSMEQIEGLLKWPEYKIDRMEFIRNCEYCGGNLGAMILTGLESRFPELYDSLPDDGIIAGELLAAIMARVTYKT